MYSGMTELPLLLEEVVLDGGESLVAAERLSIEVELILR